MKQKDERQQLLLQAASEVIAQYGLRKTTLEDIAEKAGVAKATMYYYFDSKEEIFAEVVEQKSRALFEALAEAIHGKESSSDKLIAFVNTRHGYAVASRKMYNPSREVFGEVMPMVTEKMKSHREREQSVLARIIAEGATRGEFKPCDAQLLASTIVSCLNAVAELRFLGGGLELDMKELNSLLDLFLNGLKNR